LSNPVDASDHALSQVLGPSLQSATIRLAGALIVLAGFIGLLTRFL
jgi:hypothetical protein